MIQQAMEDIMARHNTAFLNSFRQMMIGVFGPNVGKHFDQGESSAAPSGQPPRQDASVQPPQQSMSAQPTQQMDSQSIQQNLIRRYLIHVHMVRWHSILMEFNPSRPTG
jgi:hypothetical protein